MEEKAFLHMVPLPALFYMNQDINNCFSFRLKHRYEDITVHCKTVLSGLEQKTVSM